MAIQEHPALRFENYRSGTAGNAQVHTVEWETEAFAVGDNIRLMKLYPGQKINAVYLTVLDGHAGVTIDVGIEKVGEDISATDQNTFLDGASGVNVAVFESRRAKPHRPVLMQKDGYLIATVLGAAVAAKMVLQFEVQFQYIGTL